MASNRLAEKKKVATYAAVLMEGAQQAGGRDAVLEVRNQLDDVTKIVRSNMELQNALTEASYAPEQRNALARSVFADCNAALVDVLAVMAERGDMACLSRVFATVEDLLRENLNLNVVEVTTAVPLDDELRQTISNKLAADLGTDVVLRETVDKSILGGIIMSANGKRIDASVTSQLDHARNVLKQSTDGGER